MAEAFDDIREEMINNRVDTEELKTRLKDGVADPLQRIVETLVPAARRAELKKLSRQLADPQAAAATQAAALAEIDAILVEMKQVLDKMLELETFNEVLDMLRQIIDAQEKVNAETKEKQKAKAARPDGVDRARLRRARAALMDSRGVSRCYDMAMRRWRCLPAGDAPLAAPLAGAAGAAAGAGRRSRRASAGRRKPRRTPADAAADRRWPRGSGRSASAFASWKSCCCGWPS